MQARKKEREAALPKSPSPAAPRKRRGHGPTDNHTRSAAPQQTNGRGHTSRDTRGSTASPVGRAFAFATPNHGVPGQGSDQASTIASPRAGVPDPGPDSTIHRVSTPAPLSDLVHQIRSHHRTRVDFHRAEKRLTLQIKAICRRFVGGPKDEAAVLYKAVAGKGEHPQATVAAAYLLPFLTARKLLSDQRKAAEKQLEKTSRESAVWPWVESVNGFGAMGLGQIIGECGDLAIYANPAKLWKRMGVGLVCVDGEWKRQRRVQGAEALEHGYSPERRSILFCIGESLIKKQSPYRDLYLARKEYEAEKNPEAKPIQNHRRAQRYMEKRLLRDLWRAWRDQ